MNSVPVAATSEIRAKNVASLPSVVRVRAGTLLPGGCQLHVFPQSMQHRQPLATFLAATLAVTSFYLFAVVTCRRCFSGWPSSGSWTQSSQIDGQLRAAPNWPSQSVSFDWAAGGAFFPGRRWPLLVQSIADLPTVNAGDH